MREQRWTQEVAEEGVGEEEVAEVEHACQSVLKSTLSGRRVSSGSAGVKADETSVPPLASPSELVTSCPSIYTAKRWLTPFRGATGGAPRTASARIVMTRCCTLLHARARDQQHAA